MLVISVDHGEAAQRIHAVAETHLGVGQAVLSSGSRGFDGILTNDVLILAAVVGPAAIKAIADVLSSLVAARSQRQVSINGTDIRGYSARQVADLLGHIREEA